MKKCLSFIILLCAVLTVNARTVTTFDFTKIDSEGTIYGIAVEKAYAYIGFDAVFNSGNIDISFTELSDADPLNGPMFKVINNESTNYDPDYYLEMRPNWGVGGITFSSTNEELISEIKFEYYPQYLESYGHTTFEGWSVNTGSLDQTDFTQWTGESFSVSFTNTVDVEIAVRIKRITIITLAEGENTPEFVSVESISEAVALGSDSYVKFSTSLSCVSQNSDGKYTLVSDGTSVMYLYSGRGLPEMKVGEIVNTGLCGKICDIDGVPCLEVEYDTFGSQIDIGYQQVYLSNLDDTYIGKMVKVRGGIINVDGTNPTLSQGETTITINNLMLDNLVNTTSNYVEVIGDIGKNDDGYVIHPISVVESIYTSEVNITADTPHVDIRNGKIYIDGNWQTASVYNSDGKLIAKDRAEVECISGVYIVTANNTTIAKVILR